MAKKTKKSKIYAVVKGHVPGIYNDYESYQQQVQGFNGAVSKSFKTAQEAQKFMDINSVEVNAAGIKRKFYAVVKGHTPGIYDNAEAYHHQVRGFAGAVSKSFKTIEEAERFMDMNSLEERSHCKNNTKECKSLVQETSSKKRKTRDMVASDESQVSSRRKHDIKPNQVVLSCIREDVRTCLRKQRINEIPTLPWPSSNQAISIQSEHAMLPVLLRWRERERGMMKDQPSFRLPKVMDACRKHGITLEQALSLRRTHMQLLNPYKREMLGLGTHEDIKQSADRYEDAVTEYLQEHSLPFAAETDQIGSLTPDFIFPYPIRLDLRHEQKGKSRSTKRTMINWLEAKMFYGASTIPDGSKNAVGAIVPKAKRYVDMFGPGAIVFSFGFGERLRVALQEINVTILDSYPLDLEQMREHQRTWCANSHGEILP